MTYEYEFIINTATDTTNGGKIFNVFQNNTQISHKTNTNRPGQTKFITITCAHSCPLSSLHQ